LDKHIREIENINIPMQDGVRLSAKIWMPEDAEENPVPAILEYIPYRKRDVTALRDSLMHPYFARAGYASIRVDLRGSGDSEGILRDEYLQEELDDAKEVIRWLSSQTWCTGDVGMIGISWGGFNGLQVAYLAPEQLKAIITVSFTDDRYADDVHYMGGCLLTDNLSWASTMFSFNACPPDPVIVGERWKEMWLERLEGSGLWLKKWLDHQRRDEYWKHGSVCEDYSRVKCPVYAVSGWADGYTNSVFRLMENISAPCKGLIGPWNHKYPHMGDPGPSIDFINEAVKWWDHWLKGIDNDIMDEPRLIVWMQDTVSPLETKRPGHWVSEQDWPTANVAIEEYALSTNELYSIDSKDLHRRNDELTIQSPLSVGLFAGKWCSYAASTDLPWDQRVEDGGALVFDSEPLEDNLEILGSVVVSLEISSNKPQAMVAVRLSDIAPNGRATRVSYGLLNLSHRESHEYPEELEPGKTYRIKVKLNQAAQHFPPGHRLRIAISSSYWPLAWPSPEPVKLTIYTKNSRVYLPVRQTQEDAKELPLFDSPEQISDVKKTLLVPAHREWTVQHNLATNEVSLNVINNDARIILDDINLEYGSEAEERYSYINNNYDTLRGEVTRKRVFKRGDWETSSLTRTLLTSTRTHFRIRATLDAYHRDTRIFSKTWDEMIPRDMA
jgi:hypothetical protein